MVLPKISIFLKKISNKNDDKNYFLRYLYCIVYCTLYIKNFKNYFVKILLQALQTVI